MAYPDYTTIRSIAGAAEPTYLEDVLVSGYVNGQTISVDNTLTWYEVSSSGTATTNPLGTSGVFVLVVDYGQDNEEKILCASGAITIGNLVDIPIWTDGVRNGRGYDGTSISAHSVGIGTILNVFPVRTAVDDLQFNAAAAYVAVLSGNVTTISGKQITDETNIATLSGNIVTTNNNLATLSGQYNTTSGQVTTNITNIATISGKQVTDENNIATLSGQYVTANSNISTLFGQVSTISGKQVIDEANIATLSGQIVTANSNISTLSGQYISLSGTVNTQAGYIATISGKQITDEANIASTSGSLATLSGQYVATSGIVTTNTSNIAAISGSLATLSGQFVTLSGSYATTSGIVTNQAGYISTISGKQVTDEANIASTSGSLATLSGQYVTTSGLVTNQAGYISTISGKQITDEANIASLSGSLSTLSGQYVATSGIVTNQASYIATISGKQITDEANIASLSGSLSTVSGIAVAALPKTGGTISGSLIVASGLTVSGATTLNGLTNLGNSTISGNLTVVSGITISGSANQGNTLVGGTLTVSGASTLIGNTAFSGSVTVSGNSVLTSISGITANGDLSGTYPAPTVAKIQGVAVSPTAPTNNQVLRYSTTSGAWFAGTGNALFPTATKSGNYTAVPNDYVVCNATVGNMTVTLTNAPANGSIIAVASQATSIYNVTVVASGSDVIPGGSFVLTGNGIFNSVEFYYDSALAEWLIVSNNFGNVANGDIVGTYPNPTVEYIQGIPVSATPPSTGQALVSVGGVWTPVTLSGAGTPGPGGALGYYGAFHDSTTQTVATVTGVYPIKIGSTDYSNGIVVSTSGHITFGYTGVYNLQYSIQFANSDSNADIVNVWLRKNGTDVANTNSQFSIPGTSHGGSGESIAAVTYLLPVNANDYLQLMWQADSTTITIASASGTSSPPVPATPGVIVNVTQNMYNQTGTYTVAPVAASGTNAATATSLTLSTYAPVTGATASGNGYAGTGVILPTPTYNGQWMQIHNEDLTHWLLVYPQPTAYIDNGSTGAPIWMPPTSYWEGVATTTTSWDTAIQPLTSNSLAVNYLVAPGQTDIELQTYGTPGTYGTTSGIPVITTDTYGRSTVTVTGVQINQSQVTGLSGNLSALSGSITTTNSNLATLSGQYNTTSGIVTNHTSYIATLSGQMVTANANIASISGSLATLSGQYVTTSGLVTNQAGYIATLSGQMITANSNIASTSGSLATLSGQFVTLSGQYNTTSGIVTTATGNIASLSGSLATLSGQFVTLSGSYNTTSGIVTNQTSYIATISGKQITDEANIATLSGQIVTLSGSDANKLPLSGGTISGNLVVVSGFTVSGTSTHIGNATFSGSVTVSGNNVLTSGYAVGGSLAGTLPNPSIASNVSVTGMTNISGTFNNGTISGASIINGTISGVNSVNISGTLTTLGNTVLSGTSFNLYSSTIGGVAAASGQALVYSGGQWVPGTVATTGGGAIASSSYTNVSGSQGPINLYTATSGAMVVFNYYAKVTTPGGSSSKLGPITVTTVDPDGTTIVTTGQSTSANTLASGMINGSMPFVVKSGTVVSYSMAYASAGTAMQYEVYTNLSSSVLNPSTGTVSSFNGRTGAVLPSNNDYTSIVGTDTRTNVSGVTGPITLTTTTSSGLYQVNYYAKVTATGTNPSVLGPFVVTSVDPDGTTITTSGFYTNNNSLSNGVINGIIPIYAASGTNITYSIGYSSPASSMKYESYVYLNTTTVAPNITGVTSFNGRTGAVSPSVGDYTSIIATDNRTLLSGTLGPVYIATATGTGFYYFDHYAKVTTPGSTGAVLGPVSITTVDPDGTTVTNYGPFTSSNTATSGVINARIPIYVASGTSMTYTVAYTPSGNGMKYESYASLSSNQIAPVVPSVPSFNGRTGAITPTAGDYSETQIKGLGAGGVVFVNSSGYLTDTSVVSPASFNQAGSFLMSYGNIANGGPEWVPLGIRAKVQAASASNVAGTYVPTYQNTASNPNGSYAPGCNITNDYPLNVDTFTVSATGAFVIDGYTVQLGDRVLFTGQSSNVQNGIWLCTTQGTTGVSAQFCRSNDADTVAKIASTIAQVVQGTTYSNTSWQIGISPTGTLGTSPITIYQLINSNAATFTGEVVASDFKATGLPGATAASRYAGATTFGAPTTGTFAVGDYVVDQSGAMYVCIVAGTPGTWQLSGVSVNSNIAAKNFIINGGMDLNQRGASTYNVPQYTITYTLDRWFGDSRGSGTNYTMSQVSSGLTGIQYALRMQRNSGSTDTNGCWYGTTLETKNSIPLAGKVVTLSFYYRTGAYYSPTNFAIALYTGTGTDENWANGFTGQATVLNTTISPTASSGWLRYSVTALIGSTATEIGLQFTYTGTGTAGATDYIDITGVQLEASPFATSFSRAGGSIGAELALCQRYYWQITTDSNNANGTLTALGTANATSSYVVPVQFPVTMRAIPSSTVAFANLQAVDGANSFTVTSASFASASTTQFCLLSIGVTGTLTQFRPYWTRSSVSGGYIGITAEL